MKLLITSIISSLTLFSCVKEDKPISINIFKTETTYNLYKSISVCDSITNQHLHKYPIDTFSEPYTEQLRLTNGFAKSRDISIAYSPILGRISEIYYKNEDGYQLTSRTIFGYTDFRDTLKLVEWLSNKELYDVKTKIYQYNWVLDSNRTNEAGLVSFKSRQPILSFTRQDILNIEANPVKDIYQQISKFTNEVVQPTLYSLDIIFPKKIAESIIKVVEKDTLSGYLAIIRLDNKQYLYSIKRQDLKNQNSFLSITIAEVSQLDILQGHYGSTIIKN